MESLYDFKIKNLQGNEIIHFSDFKGKTLLLVNTASKCGFTPQYEQLEQLKNLHKESLVIIGFPCNQFGFQESGDAKSIENFCSINYGVTFTLTEKTKVRGPQANDLYKWLRKESKIAGFPEQPIWNFHKFLISPDGKLKGSFRSTVTPTDSIIQNLIA